mgnify:FL=1
MSHTLNCTGILFDVLYSVFNFQVPRLFHCMTFDTFSFFLSILCSYDETFTQTEGNEEFISKGAISILWYYIKKTHFEKEFMPFIEVNYLGSLRMHTWMYFSLNCRLAKYNSPCKGHG